MSTILRDLFLLGACDAPSMMTLTGPSPFFPSFSPPFLSPALRPLPLPPLSLSLSLCLFLPLSPPSSLSCVFSKRNILYTIGELPGSPVVRALRLHRRGHRFNPFGELRSCKPCCAAKKYMQSGENHENPL